MARYADAIEWIALYDDTEWVLHPADIALGTASVTAALVVDVFNKTEEQVRTDIIRALQRLGMYTGG